MWILHPKGGFLSAVEHNSDPNHLVVRARIRADLEDLQDHADSGAGVQPITGGDPNTDYPWRIIVTREDFTAYVAHLANSIDYGNFKSAVGVRQDHHRAAVYGLVWADLCRLERLDPEGRHTTTGRN